MYRILLLCTSQWWDVLCGLFSSSTSQTPPSSAASDSTASTSSQTPHSTAASDTTASTSSQTLSSRVSYLTPTSWDVFLSFRGSDTRSNFTSHLYSALDRHGIRTFMDDPELRTGEVISDALIKAIQESKIYVVVFSENYASSGWCLDELVEIYKCYEILERSVIGVYYNIDPSVVRHQTGSFRTAFEKHETRFAGEVEKLKKWRQTLANVAGFSGKHISAGRSEADIINEIVDVILFKVNPKTLDVAKYPVGLDSRVKDITTLFSSGAEGVTRIGLHGMGGVGKTTLAKAVYNENYHRFQGRCCFLANVREVLGTNDGLLSLQQKLINDVLKSKSIVIDNVDHGIEVIRARICSKEVLIVIDDLDNSIPLEFLEGPFALGSMIIITTRNEDLLDSIKLEARYKVKELGDVESRQLFTHHAFGYNEISDTFMELSETILEHAGGLPLALKVFGSNLLNQSEEGWRWFIDKLNRVPIADVEKKLVISFDALKLVDPMLQNIFLDIACFFIGSEKNKVVEILETCYTHVNHNIDILRKRCLLAINDEEENLGMHDLLRDMGRGIVRNNSPNEPGKHSRLWLSEDIHDVLKKHKGTEAIEGIITAYPSYVSNKLSLSTETFKKMSKLRYLCLYDANLTGSFEQTFENLRWLYWDGCPLQCLPSEFYPQKLGILELPNSKMRTMWESNMVSRVFRKLKTLNMSNAQDLTTTPNFKKLPYLQTLILDCCKSLEAVHISIGSLVRLVSLDLHGCVKLRGLPDTICKLRALEILDIGNCSSLQALPKGLGNLISLIKLKAYGLNVSKLPHSIKHLSKLVELNLSLNKNLVSLSDTICNLRALNVLDIHGCSRLEALPMSLGNVESLKELNAGELNVSKLPDSIGCLSKLVKLRLSSNKKLVSLPNTICDLISLEVLDISGCKKLEILPDQLWKLTRLRKLIACGATKLKKLPNIESGQISLSLQKLDLSETALTSLPSGISQLSNLEELVLTDCCRLFSIIELPPNLNFIKADGCTSMERLLNLSNSKQLEMLDLTTCTGLTEMQGLEEVASLIELDLGGCKSSFLTNTITKRLFQIFSGFGHQIEIYISSADFPDWISQSSNLGSTMTLDLSPNMSYSESMDSFSQSSNSGPKVPLDLSADESDNILAAESMDSISQSSDSGSAISIDMSPSPNMLYNLLAAEHTDSLIQSSDLESTLSSHPAFQKTGWSLDFPPNVSHNFLGMILCFNYPVDEFNIIEYSIKNTTSDFILSDSLYNSHNTESVMVIVPRSIFSVSDGDERVELTANIDIHGIYLLYKTEMQWETGNQNWN